MNKCKDYQKGCWSCCDMCKHFDFEKYECKKINESRTPDESCQDFICEVVGYDINCEKPKNS